MRSKRLPNLVHKLHSIEALGNAPARRGEIRVERIEHRLLPKVPFPHRHDFFHFLFLEKGTGWHEIDFSRFPVKSGQLFFVKPGEVHAWSLGSKTRGFVLEFTKESIGGNKTALDIFRVLDDFPSQALPEDPASLCGHLRLMQIELEKAGPNHRLALEHLLAAFLLRITRIKGEERRPRLRTTAVDKFRALVEENFRQEHSVEFYAKKLGLTPKALTTQARKALGMPAGAVIQEKCLLEAKRLLAYSEQTIAEIGYELGYEDPNYFARFFRQRCGMSPGKFRKLASHSVH